MKLDRSLFVRPVVKWIKRCLPTAPLSPDGYTPIRVALPNDVFVVGYPKSGNTWFQYIVSTLVYGVDPETTPDSVIQELVPDVHAKTFYKRFATPTYFKSHDLPGPNHRRVVYLLRDGRDAMVSFLHYLRACRQPKLEFQDLVSNVQKWCGQGTWSEHVRRWLLNPFHAQMITIRYEDLLQNTQAELRRFCDFVGIQPASGLIETVVAKTTFAKMRVKEMNHDGWANGSHASWPKDKFFIRRGIRGSYKDEMPRDVLEAFLQDAAPILAQCGYL